MRHELLPFPSYPEGVQHPSSTWAGYRWRTRDAIRYRRVLAIQAVVATVVAFAACTSGQVKPVPLPSVPYTTTTTIPVTTLDYSTVDLASVPGRTPVNVVLGPGAAALGGTVVGPDGPVAGATIHVERIVDDVIGSANVTSQPDGTWTMPSILGGQYRIRAWRQPDLSQSQPDILFLGGKETRNETLTVERAPGNEVGFAIAPRTPIIGRPAQLALQVTVGTVDDNGVVRVTPRGGVTVQLMASGHWESASPVTQDARGDGSVRWNLTCTQLGPQALSVLVNNVDVFPIGVPACSPVPVTTTSTSSPPTTKAVNPLVPTTVP